MIVEQIVQIEEQAQSLIDETYLSWMLEYEMNRDVPDNDSTREEVTDE
mgnify:CR=1 FL=1|tara:strand:- start:264 stop:407 length:144 start_codon:yes stop_codon:yes gene_type:complete